MGIERDKIVGWIQKLMAKAMDPASSPGETNSLQEKVAQLMAKYKISEMEATTPEDSKTSVQDAEFEELAVNDRAGIYVAYDHRGQMMIGSELLDTDEPRR